MLIEQPPLIYRLLFPEGCWRMPVKDKKVVYLTFDDGPIPEVTPWVLNLLDKYGIKATFFCVGDNVKKHPDVYKQVLEHGHQVGNHTFNHLQGIRTLSDNYIKNVDKASQYIKSPLFRPPHGHMRLPQFFSLRKRYKIVLWDVVTRDYSRKQTPEKVLRNVKKYTRNGSIIVFHDSLKAEKNMKQALPLAIEWLIEQGYSFETIGKVNHKQTKEVIKKNPHSSKIDTLELEHEYK